jgi:pimeloyl-ACP methyl ester carboxylesterase
MSSSSGLRTPEGPGSASGAPNLPEGFADTFTSRYVEAGDVRLHAVIGGDGPPCPRNRRSGKRRRRVREHDETRVADDVQTLVIPDCGHRRAEQAPEKLLAALTAFLSPYRDHAAKAHPP